MAQRNEIYVGATVTLARRENNWRRFKRGWRLGQRAVISRIHEVGWYYVYITPVKGTREGLWVRPMELDLIPNTRTHGVRI